MDNHLLEDFKMLTMAKLKVFWQQLNISSEMGQHYMEQIKEMQMLSLMKNISITILEVTLVVLNLALDQ
jgi:hypothetical protein